ncbi:MAG: porin, partial [Sphingobacteriia bacterium]|nr:porin [Sphingobacteriia bacterium]
MNKKLLTMAVAAAMVAPGAAMAEAVLYGKLNVSLDYANVENVILPVYETQLDGDGNPVFVKVAPGEDFKGWGMSSSGYIPGEARASRIGVKGSEDLGNGLKAIYQVEFGVNLNDTNGDVDSNADSITYRNTFIGLTGGWGTFLAGRHDTPMKISTGKLDLFADTMADYNGTVGFRDLRADNTIAYISPSFSGFQFAGAIVPSGGSTALNNGLNLNEDSIAGAYSLAGIYSNGPFYASLAYESLGKEHFNNEFESVNLRDCPYVTDLGGASLSECGLAADDATAWRVGLGLLDWNGFSLTGVYEARDHEPGSGPYERLEVFNDSNFNAYIPGGPKKVDLWQIQAAYAFGNSQVKAMYGQADYESDLFLGSSLIELGGGQAFRDYTYDQQNNNIETWAIGFDHNLSKRTKAYALYT